jgi:hypothetical protein
MELRWILAVAIGLALIVLSVAPYIKARELTMQTPAGWEVVGSKRLRVPTKELQEIYAPDGTPTGRYGRPIDHSWFGEGKLIEIGVTTHLGSGHLSGREGLPRQGEGRELRRGN